MDTHYTLECLACGRVLEDDGLILDCPACSAPGLLRTRYRSPRLIPGPAEEGLYRFRDWLPIWKTLDGSGAPVTYQSDKLNHKLDTPHLWVTFNGYWPEKSARMLTGTFKECEAFSVCARLPRGHKETLVVASAGNTARAFARVCSENRIPLLLVVPEEALPNLWSIEPLADSVKVLVAGGGADYFDSIHLSNMVTALPGFRAEGGARNVARRDGMSTTVYSAVTTMGRIPEYYFQAVGSGTGAIAAWEAALRFSASGTYSPAKMRLMVSQNAPFVPMADSWSKRSRDFLCPAEDLSKQQINIMLAKVLSNRKPPWGLTGGLFDALVDTEGMVLTADNQAAQAAARLFEETEGIDISPAASVAFASLLSALEEKLLPRDAHIMLNITGGGIRRVQQDFRVHPFPVHGQINTDSFTPDRVKSEIEKIYIGG